MMEILYERGLSLSRKKTRMGYINSGFHYLGIHYLPTQPEGYTYETHANDDSIAPSAVHNLYVNGGGVAQLLIVNCMSLYAWFRMHEHSVKHANRLSG